LSYFLCGLYWVDWDGFTHSYFSAFVFHWSHHIVLGLLVDIFDFIFMCNVTLCIYSFIVHLCTIAKPLYCDYYSILRFDFTPPSCLFIVVSLLLVAILLLRIIISRACSILRSLLFCVLSVLCWYEIAFVQNCFSFLWYFLSS
jgi:hypothetical protein